MARVVVIGAGAGGLAAALSLAGTGHAVTVLERANAPGGKMRAIDSPLGPIDVGPTVFTMRGVFDALFESVGLNFGDHVRLTPLHTLARHSWGDGHPFDLPANAAEAIDSVGLRFGAQDAYGFERFLADGAALHALLLRAFMGSQKPTPHEMATRLGLSGTLALLRSNPFATLHQKLSQYFSDARLRQLFGRYATYTGASPYQAPATLMLIAHVEQSGVWSVEGGMNNLARAIANAATQKGATFRYQTHVRHILNRAGRVCGVTTAEGDVIEADAVIVNADPAAISSGAFGAAAQAAIPDIRSSSRSLSAVTWAGVVQASGTAMLRHNVFFGANYKDEFRRIFHESKLPQDPTVYVCSQDRMDTHQSRTSERVLVLINAPPAGDRTPLSSEDVAECQDAAFSRLRKCGVKIMPAQPLHCTKPQDFHRLYPYTGGAIYGPASHSPFSPFQRLGARTRLPGLYLAGGSVHPSAGVPMATLSGQLAAQALTADLPSTPRFRPADILGGISTPSATTERTD